MFQEFKTIVENWIEGINKEKGKTEKAKLLIYGSHATGAALVDDDVDILIMAPEYVER